MSCYSLWPDHVRQRIKDTYLYFGGSVALTAVTAASAFRSPALMRFMTKSSFLVSITRNYCYSKSKSVQRDYIRLTYSLYLYIRGLEHCTNNVIGGSSFFSIIDNFYEQSHILNNHCPVMEYGRISVFGISAFCDHTFYTIVFTFHEGFFGISMRPCSWQVGFPHCPAITEATLSPVIIFLSLSEVVFFCA